MPRLKTSTQTRSFSTAPALAAAFGAVIWVPSGWLEQTAMVRYHLDVTPEIRHRGYRIDTGDLDGSAREVSASAQTPRTGPRAGQRGGWTRAERAGDEVFWEAVPELASDRALALQQPGHVQLVVHKPGPVFVAGCRSLDEAITLARQLVAIAPHPLPS